MPVTATTPEEYIQSLPEERRQIMDDLRKVIRQNLPPGFTEEMSNGMIGYVVPHTLYPPGYHVDPQKPLPFINIASQKNFVAVYHLGLYADPELLAWFKAQYSQYTRTKLDMGKSCIRFRKPDQIPLPLMGDLATRITPQKWIEIYEAQLKLRK